MESGELIDVSWQMPEEGEGEVVARWADAGGEPRERRYTVDSDRSLEALPDEVAHIIETDGRDYGVWTRR